MASAGAASAWTTLKIVCAETLQSLEVIIKAMPQVAQELGDVVSEESYVPFIRKCPSRLRCEDADVGVREEICPNFKTNILA